MISKRAVIFLLVIFLFPLSSLFATKPQWGMYRQNSRNTGTLQTNIIGVQGNPMIKWVYPLFDRSLSSPVLSPDNSVIYVATWASPGGVPYEGYLHAVRTNGSGLASFHANYLIGGFLSVNKNGKVYFSDQVTSLNPPENGNLYSVTQSGSSIIVTNIISAYNFNCGGVISSNGTLYIGNHNGKFYAFSGSTCRTLMSVPPYASWFHPAIGSEGTLFVGYNRGNTNFLFGMTNEVVRWTKKFIPISTALMADGEGNLYFGCSDSKIISFRPDGSTNWVLPTPGRITSSPALYEGVIYFGCTNRKIYAYDVNTKTEKWSFSTAGSTIYAPLLASDGILYFSDELGKVYAVDQDGGLRWRLSLNNGYNQGSSPIIGSDGTLYISDGGMGFPNGNLYAIVQGPTPPPVWKSAIPTSPGSVFLSWTNTGNITSQTLYRSLTPDTNSAVKIASINPFQATYSNTGLDPDTRYYFWIKSCFGGKTSSYSMIRVAKTWKVKAPWPMYKQNARRTGSTNTNVIGVRGNPVKKWLCNLGYYFYASPAIGPDDTVYIGNVADGVGYVYAITNGGVKWAHNVYETDSCPAIGDDGNLYVGSRHPSSGGNGRIYSLSMNDGSERFNYPTGNPVYASAVIGPDETVYIGSVNDKMYAITNNAIKWIDSSAMNDIGSTAAVGKNGYLHFVSSDRRLYSKSPLGHVTIKTLSGIPSAPVIAQNGNVFVCASNTINVFDPIGNKVMQGSLPVFPLQVPAIGPGKILYTGAQNTLYALRQDDLSIVWTNRFLNPITSMPTVGADGTVYVASQTNLSAIKDGVVLWTYTTGYNSSSSPSIGSDGSLYFGTVTGVVLGIGEGALPPIWRTRKSIETNAISLSWNAWVGNRVTSFTLFRSTVNDTNDIKAHPVAGFSSGTTNFTDTGLSTDTKYYYILRAYNSLAPSIISGTVVSNKTLSSKPERPVLEQPVPLSDTTMLVKWGRQKNLSTYTLFRSSFPSTNTMNAVRIATLSSNTTNFMDSNLQPNSIYFYFLRAVNHVGSSPFSVINQNFTLGCQQDLSFVPGIYQVITSSNFTFENNLAIGVGTLDGYAYTWTTNTNIPLGNYQALWTNDIGLNSMRTNVATKEGLWYLHMASVNARGLYSYPRRIGPFSFYKELVQGIALKGPNRIDPGSAALIFTATPISNAAPPFGPLLTAKRFYIELISGSCLIACDGTNAGRPFVWSDNESLEFHVVGTVINNVRFRVFWEGDPLKDDEVTLLVSPKMDIEDDNDVVIYNNVIDPEQGGDEGKLLIYFNCQEGELLRIRIFDIQNRRLVKELKGVGGTMAHVEYDLRTSAGFKLPDQVYGVLVEGKSWRKELKFVIRRR